MGKVLTQSCASHYPGVYMGAWSIIVRAICAVAHYMGLHIAAGGGGGK